MNPMLDIMSGFYLTEKLYEKQFEKIKETYSLTQLEIDILAFLKNNPPYDTATDIIHYRMLPKANVSQAVELLIQKELLERITDEADRRRIHLQLKPKADEPLKNILHEQNRFYKKIFAGVSAEDRKDYLQISRQITTNIKKELE